jgi:anti-sigma B factor antagonist
MSSSSFPPPFAVDLEHVGEWSIVRPVGELDMATVPTLADRVAAALGEGAAVLDLSGLSFIDTQGLTFVLQLHRDAERTGHALALVRGGRAVHRVFEVAGLTDLLPLSDSVEAATRQAPSDGRG